MHLTFKEQIAFRPYSAAYSAGVCHYWKKNHLMLWLEEKIK